MRNYGVRSYRNLSDHDFELLIADLLGAEEGCRYEVFARGADRGVDLRVASSSGTVDIVQCKHLEGSTFAQLRSAARSEASKLSLLAPQPSRYRFVTTRPLTAANKSEIRSILTPWLTADSDVLGPDDLEGLLNNNPSVERRQIKLWLTSAAQLDRAIHSATWERTNQLLAEISHALPNYVDTGIHEIATQRLRDERVLVLSGPPGIGKTTIARMLVAESVADGFEPIEISADVEEASAVIDESTRQVFFYDDFLGATFLQDRFSKNEDKRLVGFMRRCRRSSNSLFILTTREHILNQAESWYEELERDGLPLQRLLVELTSYSRRERARILYNHVFHSQLPDSARESLLSDDGYLRIVDHPNYNPRVVEHVTTQFHLSAPDQAFLEFALESFDKPERIWEHAFQRQLDSDCRDMVLLLSSLPAAVSVSELEGLFDAFARKRNPALEGDSFRSALRVLDDSFVRITIDDFRDERNVGITNPSVADFAAKWLRDHPRELNRLVEGATRFEQLDWIHSQLAELASAGSIDALHSALQVAVMRTFAARPLRWSVGAMTHRRFGSWRINSGPEGRLLFAHRLVTKSQLTGDRDFREWWLATAEVIADSWTSNRFGGLERALELVGLMNDEGLLTESVRSAITAASLHASSPAEWTAVVDVLDDAEEILDIDRSTAAREFDSWVRELFESAPDEVRDLDAFYQLEDLAARLGLATDDAWQLMYDDISARPETTRESANAHHATVVPEADDFELRTMFARLRN